MTTEHLIQFVVPLAFVGIWALTRVFTADREPLLPRLIRRNGGIGPRFVGPVAESSPPRPVRYTLRQVMLVVALISVVLAGVKAYLERIFSSRAAYHAREEALWSDSEGWWPSAKKLVDHHSRMKRMYEQATFLSIIHEESDPLPTLPPPPAPTPITSSSQSRLKVGP
jgi:hypothetical protein